MHVFYIEFGRIEKEGDPEEVGNDAHVFIYVRSFGCLPACQSISPSVCLLLSFLPCLLACLLVFSVVISRLIVGVRPSPRSARHTLRLLVRGTPLAVLNIWFSGGSRYLEVATSGTSMSFIS